MNIEERSYLNRSLFPPEGKSDIIYIDIQNDLKYRWSQDRYVLISSIATKTSTFPIILSNNINDLNDVKISTPKEGDILIYNKQIKKWINNPFVLKGLDEEALRDYLTQNKFATQDWVINKKYIATEDLFEQESTTGALVIKKTKFPTLIANKGITIDKSSLTFSMKVNNKTFGFSENDELELLAIDGGLIEN